jgi:hypothetical protein
VANVILATDVAVYSREKSLGVKGGPLKKHSTRKGPVELAPAVRALVEEEDGTQNRVYVNEILFKGSPTGHFVLSEAVQQEADQTLTRHAEKGPHQINW